MVIKITRMIKMWRTQNKVERAKCGDRLRNTICISCCTLSSLWPSTTTCQNWKNPHDWERNGVQGDIWSLIRPPIVLHTLSWQLAVHRVLKFKFSYLSEANPTDRESVCLWVFKGYLITDQPPIVPHPMPRSLSNWLQLAQSVKLPDWSSLQESVLILKDFVHMLLSSFPRLCNLSLAIFSEPCLVC